MFNKEDNNVSPFVTNTTPFLESESMLYTRIHAAKNTRSISVGNIHLAPVLLETRYIAIQYSTYCISGASFS